MQSKKAFTLLELLVVVALIALLATIVIVAVSSARAKGRDAKRMHDIEQINNAIALYQSDHNGFPPNLGNGNCDNANYYDPQCYASTGDGLANWEQLAAALAPYLQILPTDPCPTCIALNIINTALAQDYSPHDYEYVYQAPAAVYAYFADHGINPSSKGVNNTSFSIYAKRLETKEGSFGFGLSLPTIEDLTKDAEECPYKDEQDGDKKCEVWTLCQEGNGDACKWLAENICPFGSAENGEEACKVWDECKKGNEDYCKWINEKMCPYNNKDNWEELCKLWLECNKGDAEYCAKLQEVLNN